MLKVNIFIFTFLLSLICSADSKIVGHPAPLKEELISPIKLDCPVSINEWRGSAIEKSVVDNLSYLCKISWREFPAFVKKKGYDIKDSGRVFEASLLPDNKNYRNLNDTRYRFNTRTSKEVYGYTHYSAQYVFITSDYELGLFYEIWVHELFHVMSYVYGVFDQHSGSKEITDEKLAKEFSKFILR